MYLCARGIDFSPFYDFSIGFLNSVVFFSLHSISLLFVVYQFSLISWIASNHEIKNSMNVCIYISI